MKQHIEKFLPYAVFLLRIIVACVFLFAAYGKIKEGVQFINVVRAYNILPDSLIVPFAQVVPFLELIFGAWLLIGLFTRVAASVIGILLTLFIIALGVNILRGNFVNCGCFGQYAAADTISWGLVIRDLLLLACTVIVFFKNPLFLSIDKFIRKHE